MPSKKFFKEIKVLIIDDSYFGSNHKIDYELFDSVWQPFNRTYIPVYKKEKEEVVREILGEKEKAKSDFELALKYNKNFSPAREALGKP